MANMNQFKLIITHYRFKQKSELQRILFNQQDSNSRSERYYIE